MFKDSKVTRLTPWTVVEESEGVPAVNYPAFIGTGVLGLGLDAAGLQSLPDGLCDYLKCTVAPLHVTQADLYILREGMISEHLAQDEIDYTGTDIPEGGYRYGQRRNFMPLGYLAQSFAYAGKELAGAEVLHVASGWRRDWDLRTAVVRNAFTLERQIGIETEIFAPHDGEIVYLKLTRQAAQRMNGEFRWTVTLPLETRHGIKLYDQPGAVQPGTCTIFAYIDEQSAYKPSEAYAVIYGVAADGAEVAVSPDGWTVTLAGSLAEAQTAYVRLDFRRLVGEMTAHAGEHQAIIEAKLAAFTAEEYHRAFVQHIENYRVYWESVADIEVAQPDALEDARRWLLHMSEYLFRCGNNFAYGGTAQFILFHQNGWGASNFHDIQYVVDGLARVNMWDAVLANAHWMRKVMRPSGRAFPWMMTYDGCPTVTPDRDRAPMSDANRALLAIRIYELAGQGRETLLRDTLYPIIKRVADMAVAEWFYEENGRILFRGVETDIMGDEAIVSDMANVLMFLTVLKKADAYSRLLGLEEPQRANWRRVLEGITFDVVNDRYVPHLHASAEAKAGTWLCAINYIAEARPFLHDAVQANTMDYGHRVVPCNLPWIGAAMSSAEIRLGRPNRAEQFFVDTLEHRTHGPGYFEECAPVGVAALPPFATGHGAYLTAACEQVVLPDFWTPRIYVGRGMPAKFRMADLRFRNLRGRDGVILAGQATPRRLAVDILHTGDPVEMEFVLTVPAEIGVFFRVWRDGAETPYDFHGETVSVRVALEPGMRTELVIAE